MARRRKKPVSLPAIGSNGNVEVQIAEVQDPYEPDKKLTVAKNVKTSPLDWELSRGYIGRDQFLAGERFLKLYEAAEIGGARAIDYSRQKVDTSYVHKGLEVGVMEAAQELKDIRTHLGRRSYDLMVAVVGNRISIDAIAKAGAGSDKWANSVYAKHIRLTFCETLFELADYFGVVAKGRDRAKMRTFHSSEPV